MADRDDEGRHRPGPGRLWEESYAFDFAAGDGSLGGYVRLGLRPADGVAWYWAAVVGPDRPLVLVRDHDVPLPGGRSLEVRTSGLWADHTCETPLEHWTVGVEAFGVALDDPREAFGAERGDLCPLGVDLEWEAAAPVRRLDDGDGAGAGYDQACTVHGEVLVGAARIEVDGVGARSHRWGDRDWWAATAAAAPSLTGLVVDEGLIQEATVDGHPATLLAHAPVAIPRPGPGRTVSRLDRALCRIGPGIGPGFAWIEWLTPP